MKKCMWKINSGQLLLLAVMLNGSAYADPEDSWNLVAGTSIMRDSNLFRAPNGFEDDDQITSATLGFKINKPYSLQRFVVDSTLTDNVYCDNKGLNHTAKKLNTAWLWSLTPQLHGNLSSDYNEALVSFIDFSGAGRNIRKIQTDRFDAEWEVLGPLHILSGTSRTTQKSTTSLNAESDYKADAAELGVKYVLPSGSSLSLINRDTDGRYNRTANLASLLDSGFKQYDKEMRFNWLPTGKSRFSGQVTWLERRHDTYADRDYKGTAGSLNYNLTLTGKLAFNVGWQRTFSNFQTANSSYYILQGFNVSPVWQLTAKTAIRARYGVETRTYLGAINGASLRPPEKYKQTLLSIEWSPLRTLGFSASYQHNTRDTEGTLSDFQANTGMLTANLSF